MTLLLHAGSMEQVHGFLQNFREIREIRGCFLLLMDRPLPEGYTVTGILSIMGLI